MILAVAPPPPGTVTADPAVDFVPSLPAIPPLPDRAPRVPPINLASAEDPDAQIKLDTTAFKAVTSKPAIVRAGPSDDAAMLFGFPAARELRVITRHGRYAQVLDSKSGAVGWIEKDELASRLVTASSSKPSLEPEGVRQAKADIEAPEPVTGIPKEKRHNPMLLGGGESEIARRTPSGSGTNFASFVRRGFGVN